MNNNEERLARLTAKLCEWQRANSIAADRIEELLARNAQLDELEAKQEIFVTHMAEVMAIANGNNTNKLTDVVAHCLKELHDYNKIKKGGE